MRILLVSATTPEVQPLLKELVSINDRKTKPGYYTYKNLLVDILITGVGIPATTYYLVKAIQHMHYHLVLNTGIAGSFKPEIQVGEVVHVIEEQFGDIGAEDKDEFYTSFELKLEDPHEHPWTNGRLNNNTLLKISSINNLKQVKGITVNKTHGSVQSINSIKTKLNPDIETMEGASVFYVCLMENLPFYEIRAISNPVKPRNPKNWDIPRAIAQLNIAILRIFEDLNRLV